MGLIGTAGLLGCGVPLFGGAQEAGIVEVRYAVYYSPDWHEIEIEFTRPVVGVPTVGETVFKIRQGINDPWGGTILGIYSGGGGMMIEMEADIGGPAAEFYWLSGQPVFSPPGIVSLPATGTVIF